MGIFGNQTSRIRRNNWGGSYTQMLAEELFSIFESTEPIVIDSPVTFGQPTVPGAQPAPFQNPPVVFQGPVTYNNTVQHNQPVTYANSVTYQGPVNYQSPDGPVNQNPYSNPPGAPAPTPGSSTDIFVAIIVKGSSPYKAVRQGQNTGNFVDIPEGAFTISIPGLDGIPVPDGTVIAPAWKVGDTYYGATPPTLCYYGKMKSGGPSNYSIDLYPMGVDEDTYNVQARIVLPGTQSINPPAVFFPVLKVGNGDGVKWITQHATWYVRV